MSVAPASISVLMANYNKGPYIQQAIENVLKLAPQICEFLILDDCSTDSSPDIIAKFAAESPVVRFIKNDRNRGVVFSVNRLLAEAKGDYVLVLSSDDYIIPEGMGKLMDAVKASPRDGLYCGNYWNEYVGSDKRVLINPAYMAQPGYVEPENAGHLNGMHILPALGVIIKRSVLLECGGYHEELKWYLDQFINLQIALEHGFHYLPEPIAVMRVFKGTGNYSSGLYNWREAKPVLLHIFNTLRSERCRHIYESYVRHGLFKYYYGVGRLLLECPRLWDRHTLRILSVAFIHCRFFTWLRWNLIPSLAPESLKRLYRDSRDARRQRKCEKLRR